MVTRTKVVIPGEKRKPPAAGKGRKAGSVNKVTKQLKDMILGALADVGGQTYLAERAKDPKTSAAFLALIGKVLPSEMKIGNPDGTPITAMVPVFNITLTSDDGA